MLASASRLNATFAFVVASVLVGAVPAVVVQVADVGPLDAVAVGALVVAEQAGAGQLGLLDATSDVVFVRAVAAVIDAVAHVKVGDAFVVGALELVYLFTAANGHV